MRPGSSAVWLAAAVLQLTPRVTAAQLPAAGELMAAHNEAVGGEAAFARYDVIHTIGNFNVPAAGLSGGVESYRLRPNTVVSTSMFPGMGEVRGGFNGEVGWAFDARQGARLLGGPELEVMREQAAFEQGLRLPRSLRSAETVEKTVFGGQECYKVRLVWNSGRESYDCYSSTSHLLVATVDVQESELGHLEAVTLLQDYRDFGGIMLPTRMVTSALDVEQVLTIEKVDFVAPDPARVALPPEVRTLLHR